MLDIPVCIAYVESVTMEWLRDIPAVFVYFMIPILLVASSWNTEHSTVVVCAYIH